MHTSSPDERLTVSQAARRIGVSPDWVRDLCDRGELEHERVGNRWRLIPAGAVDAYIRARQGRRGEGATA